MQLSFTTTEGNWKLSATRTSPDQQKPHFSTAHELTLKFRPSRTKGKHDGIHGRDEFDDDAVTKKVVVVIG